MHVRTFNQGRVIAAGLAVAATVAAGLALGALRDPATGSAPAPPAPTSQQTSSERSSVVVQSGRSVKGRSVTVQGAPGESVTAAAQPGGAAAGTTAKGGAGGSASARGGSATSGSVEIQTVGP